ncbi:MAG: bifunctional folylpolyglutamate synthase/dihydrofolate synthase [Muribaculaceae bacterium]|nr:bifunctional folylpolyglutamate synthase/dihydrofolate synthase [Muribaculaceae bacterium]
MGNRISDEKYEDALAFLYAQLPMFSRVGAAAYKPGLERVEELSRFFNNPEKKLKAIHIAGTNGKGSTSHLIASVLQSAGYKTALYTSPHLVDFRERMKINGEMIPKERVVKFVERWKSSDYSGERPSFFELTMMMAFDWFASENVDYAVIETGMGGRLDSTNIISPLLCVITNISPDHTQFLGSTLKEIAGEKAGIIKKGIPVVIGEAEGDVEEVFRTHAADKEAPLIEAYNHPFAHSFRLKEDYSGWIAESEPIGTLEVDLAGDYQKKNINTSLAAIDALKKIGINLSTEAIKNGLKNASSISGLKGRWSVLSLTPLTICDTGHNIGGLSINMERLRKIIGSSSESSRLRMLIGFVADKAIDEILDIFPKNAEYYVTNADIPRALPAAELLKKCQEHGLSAREFRNVDDAWNEIAKDASEQDVIYIGGSTFIVADFLRTHPQL